MPSGRTGYPECAAGGKRLLQHGMPCMPGKIAGRGVPQVCGGDAIRGQSMHRRARRSAGGWMPRIVPPLLERAEAGSAGRGDASPQMTAQTFEEAGSAGGEVPRMPESFKPGSAASRPPRMSHMPGKASSRLFIARQCWMPLCREYPPCAVSKRQENRLLPYLQENPPAPHQRLENPIRHPATEDTLTGGIHQAELFFCIRNYSKTVPVAEGNVPLAGDSVVAVGTAQRPVGDVPSGGGEQRGRPSERRGASAKAI